METTRQGKIIVVSAPSGSGKSTIINHIVDDEGLDLRFSISSTNRSPRPGERDGVDYHFLTTQQFSDGIAEGRFLEWEQVYPGRFYGTGRDEVRDAIDRGHNLILDIDVKGALNVKRCFGRRAMTLFIKAPTIADLRRRLVARGTDSPDVIDVRVAKALYEWEFAQQMDHVVVNDDIDRAIDETRRLITAFLAS